MDKNTDNLYDNLKKQKDELEKAQDMLKQIEEMKNKYNQQKENENATISFKGKTIEEQLKMMQAFLFNTRCEVLTATKELELLNGRISFLESYLAKQFKTYEKEINEIIEFCNNLTIVGYEDEEGNIVELEDGANDN